MSDTASILVADVGGTHARFAIAELAGRKVIRVGEPAVFDTDSYAGPGALWPELTERIGAMPDGLCLSVAGPVRDGRATLTNSGWVIDRSTLPTLPGIVRILLLNDIEAQAHAVGALGAHAFLPIGGPDGPLPTRGLVSVVGIGTGFGAASLTRDGQVSVVNATEAGHVEFAPVDEFEEKLADRLRDRHQRASVERAVSGPALADYLAVLGGSEAGTDADLWRAALRPGSGSAQAAFRRFAAALGSALGNVALTQGAKTLVLGGGLGQRIGPALADTDFMERFVDKPPMRPLLESIQVRLLVHDEPGLFGAAAAYAQFLERPDAVDPSRVLA